MRLYYATTAHGMGHLTRAVPVIRALRARRPELELTISTSAETSWLERALGFRPRVVRGDHEPGTLQRNCFEIDRSGTLAAYGRFLDTREARLERERRLICDHEIDAVISDVPSTPIAAAGSLGVPAIALANFTWDWILEPILGSDRPELITMLRRDYAEARLHLRLPFGPESSPIARVEAAPLVSRVATVDPPETWRRLGLGAAPAGPVVLVCPGGWSADDWPPIELEAGLAGHFLLVGDLPVTPADPYTSLPHQLPGGLSFPDLVAASDLVLAKPGYGIASECVTHGKPLVSVERPDFPETPVLLEELARLGTVRTIGLEDFFAGDWGPAFAACRSAGSSPGVGVSGPRSATDPNRAADWIAARLLDEVAG